jgi:hypothetical protein
MKIRGLGNTKRAAVMRQFIREIYLLAWQIKPSFHSDLHDYRIDFLFGRDKVRSCKSHGYSLASCYGFFVPHILHDGTEGDYRTYINGNHPWREILTTVAHEFWHYVQEKTGKSKTLLKGTLWMGKFYSDDMPDVKNLPWEVEARGFEIAASEIISKYTRAI